MRFRSIYIAILCILSGGTALPTSAIMTFDMILRPETRANNLFVVGLLALAISPPLLVAGVRLLFNKPNRYGGLFSPNVLRFLAVINGVFAGLIVYLASRQSDVLGIIGGIGFLVATQGAFVLANKRAAS